MCNFWSLDSLVRGETQPAQSVFCSSVRDLQVNFFLEINVSVVMTSLNQGVCNRYSELYNMIIFVNVVLSFG